MKIFALALLVLLTHLGPRASAVEESPRPLVLAGARVLKPDATGWLPARSVLISDGRIAAVARPGDIAVPEGAETIDVSGLFLLPGLIDLHTHLLLHAYDEASWDDQVLREPLEFRTIRGVTAARATIESGFTTVRDLGTEGASYADVALRDAVEGHLIVGPRIFASTRAIVATGCYGPSGFDPRWKIPKGAQEADGIDGVRRAVRAQIAAGADWIKVYADYRRKKGAPATPTFSSEELKALVDEARSAGIPVAAHASTDEGIRRAVAAGVNSIEHGTGASDATLALMRKHRVTLCPTLAASEAIARYAGWRPGMPEHPRLRESREMFSRALRSGVTIACGSDAGVFAHGENAREIELMVHFGMPRQKALLSATGVAAAALGRENALGQIGPGYLADLIAVRGDPLEDISFLRSPALVVARGRVVVNKLTESGAR